jgi:pyruvate dehydrogenase E2 component (dihydrolipoamide acetyltransferase)
MSTERAAIEIVVPQVGEAVAEVTLVEWLKGPGDEVRKGEPLFAVDTDKAVVEVEAFAAGTLAQILVPAGSTVMPRQAVGLLEPARQEPALPGTSALPEPAASIPAAQGVKASPVARRMAAELGVDLGAIQGTGPGGRIMAEDVRQSAAQSPAKTTTRIDTSHLPRVNASPKARRLARELGVELAGLAGTGIGGMITVQDVRAGLMRPGPVATRPSYTEPAPPPAAAPIAAHPDVRPLTRLRRAIARRMAASKQTVPHFYLVADADMTHVQQLRAYCRQTLGWERAPTYTDVIVRACALALAAMPGVNVVYTDEGLVQRHTVDIGVAVSTEAGLIVPVLPQADKQSLRQTSQRIRGLVERAGRGRLREGDLSPKSIVVSNLGMYGVDAFVAIIDPPDPMILAVGRVADRVVPVDGQPAVRPMCTLSLSVDHRALDGTQGARFLAQVKDMLENPFEILAEMQT